MSDYHPVKWMADKIGMHPGWIYEHLSEIPHHRFGRSIKFTEANVAAYERQTLRAPRPMETTGHKRRLA